MSKNSVVECAVRLLTRREHGAYELTQKLIHKGFAREAASDAVYWCQQQDLQSDRRMAESVCRVRMQQGYGPVRIRYELHQKRIADEIIEVVLQDIDWVIVAQQVMQKKYPESAKGEPLSDLESSPNATIMARHEAQKQIKFLIYRGFTHDIIRACEEKVGDVSW